MNNLDKARNQVRMQSETYCLSFKIPAASALATLLEVLTRKIDDYMFRLTAREKSSLNP